MRIHFVGVRGVSMRQLAEIAADAGHTVTGSDLTLSGHRAEHVEGADLIVYSAGIAADNCELVRARQLGIPLLTRAQYLSQICRNYKNVIAVAGSHGNAPPT